LPGAVRAGEGKNKDGAGLLKPGFLGSTF
jgi:hypothetical protein